MKSFFKFLFLPFYYIFKLLFYVLLYGTIFIVCLIAGIIIIRLLYEGLMLYAGPGFDYVLETADIYKKVAVEGMELAIKEGNDLNWYMYATFNILVMFCVLFYSIPLFLIVMVMFAMSGSTSTYTFRSYTTYY
jgi:hypothetical protein